MDSVRQVSEPKFKVFIGESYPLCQGVPLFTFVSLLILPLGLKYTPY